MANRRRKRASAPPLDTLTTKKAAALAAYVEYGTVTAAVRAVGVSRQTWYNWREADAAFAAQADAAGEQVGDDLEQEAIRRAKDGSDTLLIFLLKGHKPAKYRERIETQTRDLTLEDLMREAAASDRGDD